MVANANPQQRKKKENERLKGEGDKIKLIDLRLERRRQVIGLKKGRKQDVP